MKTIEEIKKIIKNNFKDVVSIETIEEIKEDIILFKIYFSNLFLCSELNKFQELVNGKGFVICNDNNYLILIFHINKKDILINN